MVPIGDAREHHGAVHRGAHVASSSTSSLELLPTGCSASDHRPLVRGPRSRGRRVRLRATSNGRFGVARFQIATTAHRQEVRTP